MWYILEFHICLCIGNDISRIHGFVDPIISGGLLGLPWTDGNGGRFDSSKLGTRGL
jgi:hypothetical protein